MQDRSQIWFEIDTGDKKVHIFDLLGRNDERAMLRLVFSSYRILLDLATLSEICFSWHYYMLVLCIY